MVLVISASTAGDCAIDLTFLSGREGDVTLPALASLSRIPEAAAHRIETAVITVLPLLNVGDKGFPATLTGGCSLSAEFHSKGIVPAMFAVVK